MSTAVHTVVSATAAKSSFGNFLRNGSRPGGESDWEVELSSVFFMGRMRCVVDQALDGDDRSLRGPGAAGCEPDTGSELSSNRLISSRCAARAIWISGVSDCVRALEEAEAAGAVLCKPRRINQ